MLNESIESMIMECLTSGSQYASCIRRSSKDLSTSAAPQTYTSTQPEVFCGLQ